MRRYLLLSLFLFLLPAGLALNLTNNLTSYYTFEGNSTDAISGYTLNIIQGTVGFTSAGRQGQGINFTGANSRIITTTGPNFNAAQGVSECQWWQPYGLINHTRLFYVPQAGSFGYFGTYYDESWPPWMGFANSWGDGGSYSGHGIFPYHVAPENQSWFYVCGTWNKATGVSMVYVNGVRGLILDTQATYGTASSQFGIGDASDNRGGHGVYDNMAVWVGRVLNDTEVACLYNMSGNPYNSSVNCTATPDVQPPTFTVVNASITNTSFIVESVANEACNLRVCYGNTTGLGTCATAASSINASVNLSGLRPGTTYYYNVTRNDTSGNSATLGGYSLTLPTVPTPTPDPSQSIDGAVLVIIAALGLAGILQLGYYLMPENEIVARGAAYGTVGFIILAVIVAIITII